MEKLLIICGPTASGKTSLAVALAKKFNGELVNADSRQLYQGLSVVTGKDLPYNASPTIVSHVAHHGRQFPIVTYDVNGVSLWIYDLLPTDVSVSISLYRLAAQMAIANIRKRGKLPILVGGSGLYIRSVVDDIETIDVPQNEQMRNRLNDVTINVLQEHLRRLDIHKFEGMNHSDQNNPRRLIRAIEIAQFYIDGGKVTHKDIRSIDTLWVGLRRTDESLRAAIGERVENRWQDGAVDEVRQMLTQNNSASAISSLGVASIQGYVDGTYSEQEAKKNWEKEEVTYAKRQMIWFKKNSQIRWFDVVGNTLYDQVVKRVSAWYTKP